MLEKLMQFFKEPPEKELIQDGEKVKKDYAHWRLRIFYACFIGYTVFYLCKKNIAVALPGLSAEYGYSNTELGLLGSSLYLTYGIGKFVNGVIADRADVRKFLPTALILTAIANLCFGLSALFITPGEVSFFWTSNKYDIAVVVCIFLGCKWLVSISWIPCGCKEFNILVF